jgi:trigger factor
MIAGFEDQIVGMRAGGQRRIQVTFPADYQVDALKGQDAEFDIEVTRIEQPVLPPLDAALFEHYGVEADTVEGFKSEVRKNMERELRRAVSFVTKQRVVDALLAAHSHVVVPATLIQEEIHELQHEFADRHSQQGHKIDPHQLPAEPFREHAERRVRIRLLVNVFVENQGLKVEQDRVQALIRDIASSYQNPEQVTAFYETNKEQRARLDALALEEQAIDKLLEAMHCVEKETGYDEVVRLAHLSRN